MSSRTKTIVTNDYAKPKAGRKRARTSIEVKSTPLVHVFDDTAIAVDVAKAIRSKVEKSIKAITETASKGTLKRREYARRKLGSTSTSTRLFNDTGRLAEGLEIKQERGTFTTNIPADRFNERGGELVAKLRAAVPELRDPAKLLRGEVRQEIEASVKDMIVKAPDATSAKRVAKRQERLNRVKSRTGRGG